MLRTIYHTLTQRRFYYHLAGEHSKCNFRLSGNRMQGFNGKFTPNEILNQFENLIYVDIPELSAPLQIDKWFQCGFFDKSKTLLVMFQHLENRASCFQYFGERNYNFVSLVDLDQLRLDTPKAVFYPFNHITNSCIMNHRGPKHVFIGHGESDKWASINPMFRMYDAIFVSGNVAVERLRKAKLINQEDINARRTIRIGLPFLGEPAAFKNAAAPTSITKVLYAPTWEGASAAQYLSSLENNLGQHCVKEIIDQLGNCTLSFQPHPGTGEQQLQYVDYAVDFIKQFRDTAGFQLLVEEDSKMGASLHAHSSGVLNSVTCAPRTRFFNEYDLVITDVSSVISNCLFMNRPHVVIHKKAILESSQQELLEQFPLCAGALNYVEKSGFEPSKLSLQERLKEQQKLLQSHREQGIGYEPELTSAETNTELFGNAMQLLLTT